MQASIPPKVSPKLNLLVTNMGKNQNKGVEVCLSVSETLLNMLQGEKIMDSTGKTITDTYLKSSITQLQSFKDIQKRNI